MATTPSGTGIDWTNAENVDVDQPLGLSYRHANHIALGVDKRSAHEHTPFDDATVGMIHKPGGCAILGIEDGTATVLADGTLKGHGLVWDGTEALWCSTAVAGASTTGDFTIVQMNPNTQWKGGDITWAGAQQFDASVIFDCTQVIFNGDVSIVEHFACGSDVEIAGDFSVDGTADFGDGVAFAAEVSVDGIFKTDATATEFGGTAGIGLFYDPTVQGAAQSITHGNGLIQKHGITGAIGATGTVDISYGAAFPTALKNVQLTIANDGAFLDTSPNLTQKDTAGMTIQNGSATAGMIVYWQAWGY